jgi:hypothetical protein
MATTQLLDGSIRICKVLTPNPRTEWQLEVTSKDGVQVTMGLDFPLREFLREVLDQYPDDMPARIIAPWGFDEIGEDEEDLGDVDHLAGCSCADCENGV